MLVILLGFLTVSVVLIVFVILLDIYNLSEVEYLGYMFGYIICRLIQEILLYSWLCIY